MDELHVGSIVHHVIFLPAEAGEPGSKDTFVCEAAIVTKIRDREQEVVDLQVFPNGSVLEEEAEVPHGRGEEMWHYISECWTGS